MEPMELDYSVCNSDAMGSSMNDFKELYPSECDIHHNMDHSHESLQLSSSDLAALYEDTCSLPVVSNILPESSELDEILKLLVKESS